MKSKGKGLTKKQRKEVKSIVTSDDELKQCRYIQGLTGISSAASVWNLLPLMQGDEAPERIGDYIMPKYLDIRYGIQGSVSPETYDVVRVIIFKVPSLQDDNALNTTDLIVTYLSPLPVIQSAKQSFHVLYDKVHSIGNIYNTVPYSGNVNGNHSTVYVTKRIKLRGKTAFSDNVAVIGNDFSNMRSGAYGLLVMGKSNTTQFTFNSRIYFTDS